MKDLENLKPIKWDKKYTAFDFSFTPLCPDRIITKLTLDDYDWMQYVFEAWLPTKEQGLLHMKAEYFGSTVCTLKVIQEKSRGDEIYNKEIIHEIKFKTELFEAFITDFMKKHIAQWHETYAFNGGEEAVKFYNRILRSVKNKTDYKIIKP